MEKCASHSARAGESNASINGPVGLLRTQPPSVLSIHPHHIGFFENFAHTHTRGGVFLSKSIHAGKSTEIQKNVKKCAFASAHRDGPIGVEFQIWVPFSLSTPTCIPPTVRYPHHTARPGWGFGNFAKMNKNRKKYGKMWKRLGACRGVECIHHRPSWTTSHPATLRSFHPSPSHWIFRKLRTHTHTRVRFLSKSIHAGKSTEIQINVEKCASDSAHRVGPGSVEFQFWVPFSFSTPKHPTHSLSTPHRVGWHQLDFAKMNKNRKKYGKMCITLGACRGVECNLQQPNWTTSHPATLRSFHPSPPHWVFSKTSHTHTHGVGFSVDIDPCWKINRNSEKCGKMCIRLGAQGWSG